MVFCQVVNHVVPRTETRDVIRWIAISLKILNPSLTCKHGCNTSKLMFVSANMAQIYSVAFVNVLMGKLDRYFSGKRKHPRFLVILHLVISLVLYTKMDDQ